MEQALNNIVYLAGLAKASQEIEAWQSAINHIADIAIEAIKNKE